MDTLEIIRQLRADPALADELRAALLSQEFLGLPGHVAKVEERLLKLEERMAKVEERLLKLEERMAKVEERLLKLEERMAKVEERLAKVEDDLGEVKGAQFEDRVRSDPRRYLSRLIRRPVATAPDDFDLSLLDEDDADFLRQGDAVVRGLLAGSGEEVAAAVEASWKAHQDDLDKATKRAPLLARVCGLPVLPVVVSHDRPSLVVIEHARAAGVGLLVAGGRPPLSQAQPVHASAA
jgi:uncharacterized coiled-coil protein SlyX